MLVLSGLGMARLESSGRIVDDIPHDDALYRDLMFFEEESEAYCHSKLLSIPANQKGQKRTVDPEIDRLQNILALTPNYHVRFRWRCLQICPAGLLQREPFDVCPADAYDMPFILRYIP